MGYNDLRDTYTVEEKDNCPWLKEIYFDKANEEIDLFLNGGHLSEDAMASKKKELDASADLIFRGGSEAKKSPGNLKQRVIQGIHDSTVRDQVTLPVRPANQQDYDTFCKIAKIPDSIRDVIKSAVQKMGQGLGG